MTAALAFRAPAAHFGAAEAAPAANFTANASAEDSFTLEDYVSLFVYDGPARPGILDSELVTLAS